MPQWDCTGWMEFLAARSACIRSMREQGLSYEEITRQLNLDDGQAQRIYEATTGTNHSIGAWA